MKVNKYFPFAFVYFFVNSVALPFGVTYMALLAPFFYLWILLKRKKEVVFMDSVLRMRKISWRFKYSEIQFADNSGGMAAS